MSVLPAKPAARMEWPPSNCYPLDILVDESSAKKFLCNECGQLAMLAMMMDCDEHEKDQVAQSQIYGKQCILAYLKSHGDKCPIGGHPKGLPAKSKFVRATILQLIAICPRKAHARTHPSLSFPFVFCATYSKKGNRAHTQTFFPYPLSPAPPSQNHKDLLTNPYVNGLAQLETSM